MYLSYAMFCEGNSDRDFLGILVPRVIETLIMSEGQISVDVAAQPIEIPYTSRRVEDVAKAACNAREAFYLFFVHADTGGRALDAALQNRSGAYCEEMRRLCAWPCDRCVVIAPRRETEAWVMLDHAAVAEALGFNGSLANHGMPRNAQECERLEDPKAQLDSVIRSVTGRRRRGSAIDLFPAIAGRLSIDVLRTAQSFTTFENRLRLALQSLGCLPLRAR